MGERNCRVTVAGADKRVDVAVPARAPIGEYVASLALLCGEQGNDIMPAAWSLATPERGTLPPALSLTDSGIADGQVLYLRDLTAGEYDEPGVFEVHEVVADVADRAGGPPWNAQARTAAVVIAGVAWLVAVVTAVLVTGSRIGTGPLAAGIGLMLAVAAWVTQGSRLAVPAAVRVVLALGALPCLGVAGWFVGISRSGGQPGMAATGLAAGVLAGALIGMVAMPAVATFAATAAAAVAAAVVTTLAMLHAGLAGSSAVVALTAYAAVVLAPRAAGRLAAAWAMLTSQVDPEVTVVQARRLLAAGNIMACVTLSIALVLLGASPDPYAIALAICLSLAVLLHTTACSFLAEAVPAIAAGLAGLFSVLLFAAGHLGAPAWTVPVAGAGLGIVVLAAGLALSLRRADRAAGEPAWSRITAYACFVVAVPLAVGVFGVFSQLMHLGRHL